MKKIKKPRLRADMNISEKTFTSKSPDQTREIAACLASGIREGDTVALSGELGAGKTCFAQGLGWGLGVNKKTYLSSPTFTIVKEYQGKFKIFHIDLYRLSGPDEFLEAGGAEYLAQDAVAIIEWPEKIGGEISGKRIFHITIEAVSSSERKITVRSGD
jgi:tRNA threonylcarbamoyladenosine biosynthesis protein TsaE